MWQVPQLARHTGFFALLLLIGLLVCQFFFQLGVAELNLKQGRESHLNSTKNLGDLEIAKMRFGIRSHLAMASIIRWPHNWNFKSKIPNSCEVKWQQKGAEGREEIKIFSVFLFSLFALHMAKSLSLRSNSPRYTSCWATVTPLWRASCPIQI